MFINYLKYTSANIRLRLINTFIEIILFLLDVGEKKRNNGRYHIWKKKQIQGSNIANLTVGPSSLSDTRLSFSILFQVDMTRYAYREQIYDRGNHAFIIGLFALLEIPKNFCTENKINIYLRIAERENSECKKCKQREQISLSYQFKWSSSTWLASCVASDWQTFPELHQRKKEEEENNEKGREENEKGEVNVELLISNWSALGIGRLIAMSGVN